MHDADFHLDNAAHLLHHSGCTSPCDREIEAAMLWKGYALLLSSDTDCLSLWDSAGLVRTVQVGVYPQDMAVQGDIVYICGGADGKLHLLSLPGLHPLSEHPLPGMPERIAIMDNSAFVLTLLTDPDVQTALLQVDPACGSHRELARFPGLPGALLAEDAGLWVAVSEKLLFMSYDGCIELIIDGFGLIRRLYMQEDVLYADDPLEDLFVMIARKPRAAIRVLHRGDANASIFK